MRGKYNLLFVYFDRVTVPTEQIQVDNEYSYQVL